MVDILKDRIINEKDAVMFDIDDTLIFTNGKENVYTINLLKHAMSLGYKIVIITARPNTIFTMMFTRWQLKRYGIPYHILIITPAVNKGKAKINTGLNYTLSVGDQPTDLTHTKYALKIST